MYRFLRFVPKNHASYFVGRLVHMPLPQPLATPLVRWFARAFDIDTEIAARPIHEYPSIGAFFTRELKGGARPIAGSIVSPVDGTLRGFGAVSDGRIEQVKGRTYSMRTFLGDDEMAASFEEGIYFNFYLSPQDYHHVHSPVEGDVVKSIHVPGRLWPVNDWSLRNIENLFSINERVVTFLQTASFGLVAVVMVGATNVGKMSVTYDAFITNTTLTGARRIEKHTYEKPHHLAAGARLGTFHMGSSVVVLFEKGRIDVACVQLAAQQKVLYGQALLRAVESRS
ncbi:MAG TPA: archaetidylserine decarboxylase [Thermoanaerobaculia bacterium]|nr:archaetidylserine decarboxylase [Thermoanaerobaculia bacterium]